MPRKPFFVSIKTRFLVLLTFFSAFFISVLITAIAGLAYNSRINENKKLMLNYIGSASRSLDLLFEHSFNNVETIASLGDLKDFVLDSYEFDQEEEIDDQEYLERQEYIRSELEEFNLGNQYLSIYLMDRNGDVLVATDRSFENNNFSFREYFKKAILGESASDAVIGSISKELGFFFSAPIFYEQEVIGTAVVKLSSKRVFELFNEFLVNYIGEDKGKVFLLSQNKQIMYCSDPECQFKFLEEPKQSSLDKLRIKAEDVLLVDPFYQQLVKELDNYQGKKFFQLDDKDLNFAITSNQSQDFFIVFEQKLEVITEEPRRLAALSASVILVMSLVLSTSFYFLIQSLIKPIRKIEETTKKIAKGSWDYEGNLLIDRNDEIGDLSRSFKVMADKIKNSQGELTQEVENKTADLKNKLLELEKMTRFMSDRELKMMEMKKEIKALKEDKDQKSKAKQISGLASKKAVVKEVSDLKPDEELLNENLDNEEKPIEENLSGAAKVEKEVIEKKITKKQAAKKKKKASKKKATKKKTKANKKKNES